MTSSSEIDYLKKILKVIEGLTMGELVINDYQEITDTIYRFSHLASSCKNSHADWQEELEKTYDALHGMGLI